jgi:hypothetical protein
MTEGRLQITERKKWANHPLAAQEAATHRSNIFR